MDTLDKDKDMERDTEMYTCFVNVDVRIVPYHGGGRRK
jgi:hypothetical protein